MNNPPPPGCAHNQWLHTAHGADLVCRSCGQVVTWPRALAWVLEALPDLAPADLPEVPWILHSKPPSQIGRTYVHGAPYLSVTDNERWLAELRREVGAGVRGPRYKSGVLTHDLYSLARVLRQADTQRSYF